MAFCLSSLSKSLSSLLLHSQSQPNSPPVHPTTTTTLRIPVKASGLAPLVSTWVPKSTSTSTSLSSSSFSSSSSSTIADEIASITCPSLAYANTLFFKSGYYNVQVVVAENEPEEKLLSRFRRAVFKGGVIQECKRRRFFESSQDKKKRKVRDAAKRNRKRRPQPKVTAKAKEETPKKKDDDEDDNWELPEGDLP